MLDKKKNKILHKHVAHLRKNNEISTFLLNALGDVVWVRDLSMQIVYISDSVLHQQGFTAKEVMQMPIEQVVTPGSLAYAKRLLVNETAAEMLAVKDGNYDPNRQIKIRVEQYCKNGSTIWVEHTVNFLRDNDGTPLGLLGVCRNISDTRAKEIALHESEKQYRQLVDLSQGGIWAIDNNGITTFVNPKMAQMLDYEVEEMVGQPFLNFMDDVAKKEATQKFESRSQGLREQHDFEFQKKDGTKIYTTLETSPITDENDKFIGALAFVVDISKRRKAEQLLLVKDNAIANSISAIAFADTNGKLTEVNASFLKLWGYEKADEVIGRSVSDFWVHPEQVADLVATLWRDYGWIGKLAARKKDGTIITVQISANLIRDEFNEPICLMGSFIDITDQELSHQELNEHRNLINTIINSVNEGVIVYDLDFRYVIFNPFMEKITGITKEMAIGQCAFDLFPHLKEKGIDKLMQRASRGEIVQADYVNYTVPSTGHNGWVQSTYGPLRNNTNQIIGVWATIIDISEHRRRDDERLKLQKLESLGTLAGGIAHDFNNILTGILGYLTMGKLQIEPSRINYEDLTDLVSQALSKSRDYLISAENAALSAQMLTQKLLTFSKGGEPIKKLFDMNQLLKESSELALSGSGCSVSYSLDQNLHSCEADPGQIRQVIMNLVTNARQAMAETGTIKVKTENCTISDYEISTLKPGSYVKVQITDSGIGIKPDNLNKIFDPYFTTKSSGHGLGLAVCQSVISRHQGQITVESTLGVSTTFSVYLPGSKKLLATIVKPQENLQGSGRILIMDDEEIILQPLKLLLPQFGFNVVTAYEGEKAIAEYLEAIATNKPFDIVILDLTIKGGLGGKETIKRLLEINPLVKAIVSSGYANDLIMAEYKTYGFKGISEKPYKIDQLIKEILRVQQEK